MSLLISTCFKQRLSSKLLHFPKNERVPILAKINSNSIHSRFQHTKSSFAYSKSKFLKFVGLGFGVGTVIAGLQLYKIYQKSNNSILGLPLENEYILSDSPPEHKIAYSVSTMISFLHFKNKNL